jgi:hypothetical protein
MLRVWAVLLLVGVDASASDAPVISLNLDESLLTNAQLCMYEEEWKALVGSLMSNQFPGAPSHCSPELLAKTCEVFSTEQSCPEPEVKGYDHHEGEMLDANGDSLVHKEYIQNVKSLPGQFPPLKSEVPIEALDYSVRGETLIQYSAIDKSGNEAEKVHFVMIIGDTTAPSLSASSPYTSASFLVTLEAHQGSSAYCNIYALPALDAVVTDTYDGDVSSTRTIGENGNPCTGSESCGSHSNGVLTTDKLGAYLFDYTFNDYMLFCLWHQPPEQHLRHPC